MEYIKQVTDPEGIQYLSPEFASLMWKVPLRPHIGTLGVMPNNTGNYIDEDAPGGANTIPPSRFGGNVDDWRIGKGGTMYYRCEVSECDVTVEIFLHTSFRPRETKVHSNAYTSFPCRNNLRFPAA